MPKLKKKPSRQAKRERNAAKDKSATARGAKPTHLTHIQKILMGKGAYQSFKPLGGGK